MMTKTIASLLLFLPTSTPIWAAEDTARQASPPGCIDTSSSQTEKKAAGDKVRQTFLAPQPGAPSTPQVPSSRFGTELSVLAQQNVFENLWARCGLSLRDRSLVIMGVLIALRAENELRYHFPIAIRNGVTRREIEEVIYQTSGYAGFPAAASAMRIARETIPDEMIADKAGPKK